VVSVVVVSVDVPLATASAPPELWGGGTRAGAPAIGSLRAVGLSLPQPTIAAARTKRQLRRARRADTGRRGMGGEPSAERGHPPAARRAVVEVLLGELVAPVAEAQVVDRPRQLGGRGGEGEELGDDLQRLARRPIEVGPTGLGLHHGLPARGGCAESVLLAQPHEPACYTAMKVMIFHGYLLRGTGSNVYNAELAPALAALGHEVHLLAQDPAPEELGWVDAVGSRVLREPVRVTVHRPALAGVLPVYVLDRYAGVQARTFAELSEAELDDYLAANVRAVAEVTDRVRPDVALANHLVMGPAILARALGPRGVPYAVKVHGSALEYTVKRDPERFLPYAREGLAGARGILVGSRHTAESLWAALADPGLPPRTRLGPPGVDIHAFRPRSPEEARAALAALVGGLAGTAASPGDEGSAFARDPAEAARALAGAVGAVEVGDPLVAFVGKLIVSKGVDLLLAAWPLVLARVPRARLVVVGFGALRPALEDLAAKLAAGDLAAVRVWACRGRGLEGGEPEPLAHLLAFLDALDGDPVARARYLTAARGLPRRIAWTGRLEHAELAGLLPACTAQVVPSTFPEAFGMVAAEAAACGALPVSAAHSGLAEVAGTLAAALEPADARLLSFGVGPRAVPELAARVIEWLGASAERRARVRGRLAAVARERYGWEGVAEGVLAAAAGRLDALPEVPGLG